ncbi:hypothetical protein KOR42_52160 [Thalassoglobus neptunius]|uniref:Inosine-uridine preferring nucleoside hydrolase n=1 Tax=Thalassoglobus neptunius TaxID=1938619 RepID=A0A5C5VAQ9_9PLAN|nr:DUF1593 domain-containing protein [Thalassoglobus neptunius]TWT35090.1 hypothetical protein KOR42_52160 [Thalassoglobus neptunius]
MATNVHQELGLRLLLLLLVITALGNDGPLVANDKPRIITTTDLGADPDDEQSMVRLLVSANEFDIEGLIVSTGCWKKSQSDTKMLDKLVDAYGKCFNNLSVHAKGFPSVDHLRSISVMGQRGYGMSDVGDGKDSPGSDLIIASVDKDDPRPVWVGAWGGANNVAQAIWKVRATRSKEELSRFLSKLRVFDILGQDDAGAWIARNFPEVLYIRATGVYGWQPPKNGDYQRDDIQSHGPLGAVYPDTKWATEGDTPALLHVYPNGLNDPDQVDQGGWGGRFDLTKKPRIRSMKPVTNEGQFDPYLMFGNSADGAKAIKRWSTGYDNDFAARMDWSITSKYEDANHHPVAVVNGDTSRRILQVTAAPGSTVDLNAVGSSDPDKDPLTFAWSFYKEPSSCKEAVEIEDASAASSKVTVPENAAGKSIHIVLELHDGGEPSLYAYRRVIINVQSEPKRQTASSFKRLRVIVSSDFPPFPVTNSDPDDVQSMVRFLLHSNEFDVEGLVASAGTFGMVAEKKNILAVLDEYDKVDENLREHDPKYPTADALRAVTYEGKGNNNGIKIQWGCGKQPVTDIIGKGKDSEASNAIIVAVDKPDPRPVYIGVWGGPREIAQAIWNVKNTRSEEETKAFIGKLRIFLIACQDASHEWLMEEFPDLHIIESKKTYQGMFKAGSQQWAEENIINGHGPLCAIYPPKAIAGPGVIEGDSPAFLYLLSGNRGINDPEDPTQPSWGGQYVRKGSTRHFIDGPGGSTISKWKEQFQREFAKRADWCLAQ